jgi:hypothetical protein
MRRTVKVVTAPAIEPITLGEVKTWAKIDGTDEDALLTAAITAAREAAEQYLRRSLITQTLRLTLDLEGSGLSDRLREGVYDLPVSAIYGGLPNVIELPRGPTQAITSVVTYDLDDTSSTFATSDYSLNADGSRLVLAYGASWPSNLRAVAACAITYTAGYGDTASSVPQAIRTAILMHVQTMYDGRMICEMPPPCEAQLRKYRIMDALLCA